MFARWGCYNIGFGFVLGFGGCFGWLYFGFLFGFCVFGLVEFVVGVLWLGVFLGLGGVFGF